MFFIVVKQNTHSSRVIEIRNEQKLIDTGLYSFVRHPMYLGSIILFGFAPLVPGSFYALLPILLIIRIRNDEKVLIDGLKGYDEYIKKVKYRLLPFIWQLYLLILFSDVLLYKIKCSLNYKVKWDIYQT